MKKLLGFSLVELLISVSIVAIVSTVGLASYVNFSRSQTVTQAARQIVDSLRQVQSLAGSNQKPALCGNAVLSGYSFKIETSRSYKIYVECGGPREIESMANTFSSVLSLSPVPWQVTYLVLKQGAVISPAGSTQITLSGYDNSIVKKINVGDGEIRLSSD